MEVILLIGTDKLPYVTMGSGSLAAMAIFEHKWQPNMTVQKINSEKKAFNW